MTAKTLEQEAREAAKLYCEHPDAMGNEFVRYDFANGYLAAAEPRDKEIAELRKQVEVWKWIHNNNLEGLMILHDRQDLIKEAGVRIGDNISSAVPYLVEEIDRLRARVKELEGMVPKWVTPSDA